jgi:hypothetical protein
MDVEGCIAAVEAAAADADATLSTELADHFEQTAARLWRGQVLVDWEPDPLAGGCLLRPELLRRLLALHARSAVSETVWTLTAPGRVLAALSPEHADLVRRLGGPRRVELVARLRFDDGDYLGGEEAYFLVERGRRVLLLTIRAQVRLRRARAASPHTSPGRT